MMEKNQPTMWEAWVQSLGWKDPLEKGESTHSNILAWRIPWTAQSMGLQRVGHFHDGKSLGFGSKDCLCELTLHTVYKIL